MLFQEYHVCFLRRPLSFVEREKTDPVKRVMLYGSKFIETTYSPTIGSPEGVSASSTRCEAYPAPAKKSQIVTLSADPTVIRFK